jgi:hypothetical protein
LELKLAQEVPLIETDAPVLPLALFENAEHVMEGLESGGWLALKAEVSGDRFQVHPTRPFPKSPVTVLREGSVGWDFPREVMEQQDGKIWTGSSI